MSRRDKIIISANAVVAVATGAWVYYHPAWDSLAAFLAALAVLVGKILKDRKDASATTELERDMGKGGAAIRMGRAGKLAVKNKGEIRAGKGGTGGDGGDAIHVAEGLDVTIINHGVIAGGDAGGAAVPAFIEKQVNFRYPLESGLQAQLEAEGFHIAWVNRSRVETLLAQGWETVQQPGAGGKPPARLCLKNSVGEDQLLMKRTA